MDLNGRVDQLDGEMKLLKNEIKQVLLEVQEHVLNAQNPFAGGGGIAASGRGQPPVPAPAPAPAQPPAPAAAPVSSLIPSIPGAQAIPMGGTGGIITTSPSGFGEPAIGPGEPPMQPVKPGFAGTTAEPLATQEPEVSQPSTEAASSVLSDDDDDSGPSLAPEDSDAPGPSRDPGLDDEFDDDSSMALSNDDSSMALSNNDSSMALSNKDRHPPTSARPKASASTRLMNDRSRDRTRTQFPKEESPLATQKEREPDRSDSQPNPDDPGPLGSTSLLPNQESGFDLITIAGLAQWCDRALEKIGKDNFQTLINVSEMTGRVTKETRDIILALVPLFENPSFKEKEEVSISAKDIITLLAQLDGMLAGGPMTDKRLLPFLLQQ